MINLFLLSLGLAVDTTVASFTQGSFARSNHIKEAIKIALCFALFQGIMPILGHALAKNFLTIVQHVDHWLAFVLFQYLGIKLMLDAYQSDAELRQVLTFNKILLLSLATSVDALLAGVILTFMKTQMWLPVLFISMVTFISSLMGYWLGHRAKHLNRKAVEILGGLLLIFLGIKILVEHLLP